MDKAEENSKKFWYDWHLLRRIIRLSRPYRLYFISAVFLTILLALLAPIRPWLAQVMLDDYIVVGDIPGLNRILIILFAVLVFQAIVSFLNLYVTNWIGQSVIKDLRMTVYRKLIDFKLGFYDKTPVGTMVTRSVNDVETVNNLFSQGLITIIGDILQLVSITAVMFYINWRLALITLSVLPLLLYASHIFRVKVKSSFELVRTQVARLNAFVQERVTGMQIVQLFNRQEIEKEKFSSINRDHYRAHKKTVLYYAVFFPVVEIITATSLALLVWWGTRQMLADSSFRFGELTAFILFINMFFRPVRMMADRFNTIQMGMVASDRIFKLLDNPELTEDRTAEKRGQKLSGDIEFKDVWFAYIEEDYVLKDVSFVLPEGKTLAIVGATGAGKSSIINLLGRFYEINKGDISIGGKNISECSLEDLRSNMAIVLQDVFLFSGSVKDNIGLYDQVITEDIARQAAGTIGAEDFINELPDQFEYNVMERGSTLSTGQRQLISFIRALAYDPEILILDEATSSVDTETEELIQEAIARLMKDRTAIVIAHRLSTVRNADTIMVLDHGEIKEMGNHDELLAQGGLYKKLHDSQLAS